MMVLIFVHTTCTVLDFLKTFRQGKFLSLLFIFIVSDYDLINIMMSH